MVTPLARDQQSNPIDLPPEAAYWRVRRHTGGRPSTVLGPDGEPLFVPINADRPDLRANGCNGSLRLEAVDGEFRSVNAAVAFVELGSDDQSVRNSGAGENNGNTDLVRMGFEAMTRTVEAMQRAQVERERAFAVKEKAFADAQVSAQRMHGELLIALCERVGGGKPQDALSLIREQTAIQRALEQATPRNAGALPAAALAADATEEPSTFGKVMQGVAAVAPAVFETVVRSASKGDEQAAERMRRNFAPYVQTISALGGIVAPPPATAAVTMPILEMQPISPIAASQPIRNDGADIVDDEEASDRVTPPRALREVFAYLDDDDADAFEEYWASLDAEDAAALGDEAQAIADINARTAWLCSRVRGVDDDDATDFGPSTADDSSVTAEKSESSTAESASGAGIDVPPALLPVLLQLTPEEQAAGMQILSVLDRATVDHVVAQLAAMPTERALATVRDMIATARKRSASIAHRAVASALSNASASGDVS